MQETWTPRQDRMWSVYLCASALLVAFSGFAAQHSPGAAASLALAAVGPVAVLAGIRRHQPRHPVPWALVATGSGLAVMAEAVKFVAGTPAGMGTPTPADLLAVFGLVILCVGVAGLVRAHSPDRDPDGLLAGASACVGAGLVTWILIVEPMTRREVESVSEVFLATAYPLIDLALVCLVARLFATPARPRTAAQLLIGALSCVLVADMGAAIVGADGGTLLQALHITALCCYVLVGAAALHPSMRELTEPAPASRVLLGKRQLIVLGAGCLTGPALLIVQAVRGEPLHGPLIGTATALLLSLVLARLSELVGLAARDAEAASEARLTRIVEQASDVIIVLTAEGKISYASDALARHFGVRPEGVLGRTVGELVVDSDRVHVEGLIAHVRSAGDGTTRTADVRVPTVRHGERSCEIAARNLLDDPNVAGIVLTMRDVTERARLEEQLRQQVFHDPLTGLANRSLLLERLTHAIERGVEAAVLVIDLDDFATVNDGFGHEAGDELLVVVGARIRSALDPRHTVARLGADEFGVLLEGESSSSVALTLGQQILDSLRQPAPVAGAMVALNACVGIALPTAESTSTGVLRDADTAMHTAKAAGAGTLQLFTSTLQERAVERFQLSSDLALALDQRQFQLVYQPIVDVDSGDIRGAEALLRWQHPTRGLMSPLEFVPLAEETGHIIDIGRWVLRRACGEAARWRGPGQPYVSVNVSAVQLRDGAFVNDVTEALELTGLEPSRLLLELTESVLMDDTVTTLVQLRRLRATGARIAVDDFGTGYCSLAYLQRFPVDVVKVDRAFVRALERPDGDSGLLSGILSLAQALGLGVIAEGVETAEQRAVLRAVGYDTAQGYLFARPLPGDELEERLLGAYETTPA